MSARVIWRCALAAMVAVAAARAGHAAADPAVAILGPSGATANLTASDLVSLPATRIEASFQTEKGPRHAVFEGPLLWTLLGRAQAIDSAKPRDQVRETILVTGRDGYTAALALGEVSPFFEGKQVILAETMDGRSLGPDHFRIVVPGDRFGGRSVRDVVRIAVTSPQPPHAESTSSDGR